MAGLGAGRGTVQVALPKVITMSLASPANAYAAYTLGLIVATVPVWLR